MVVFKQEIETRRLERHKKHVLSRRQLTTIERSNFVVVNLPEKIVAQLGAKSFEFVNGIDVEQKFVYVLKFGGKFARQIKRIDATNGFAWFKVLNALDVLKMRQIGSVADDVDDLVDSGVEFSAIDVFV